MKDEIQKIDAEHVADQDEQKADMLQLQCIVNDNVNDTEKWTQHAGDMLRHNQCVVGDFLTKE